MQAGISVHLEPHGHTSSLSSDSTGQGGQVDKLQYWFLSGAPSGQLVKGQG